MLEQEGTVEFRGDKTWYKVYGDLSSETVPLIGIHGGPGWPHYGLLPLTQLAQAGQTVILYDQIGCGKSDRPDDSSLWSVEFFVEELNNLLTTLGLQKAHFLGHSWGGTLAIEYTLKYPMMVDKLILNSPLVDTRLWVQEANKLKALLPNGIGETMTKHEAEGTTDSDEYADAYKVFQRHFVCRIVPQPPEHDKADEEWGKDVYQFMWGPSEAYATGILEDYSIIEELENITVPTLIISGKYDEATPTQMEIIQRKIPKCEWVMLEDSSHSSLFEETEDYLKAVSAFLT